MADDPYVQRQLQAFAAAGVFLAWYAGWGLIGYGLLTWLWSLRK